MNVQAMTPARYTTVSRDFLLQDAPVAYDGRGQEFQPRNANVRVERTEDTDGVTAEVKLTLRGELPSKYPGWSGGHAYRTYSERIYPDLPTPDQLPLVPGIYLSLVLGVVELLDGLGEELE